ncbi:MAG: hypothetical protein MJZ37_09135 [Bacilli bacterium]|nr:hypothetical protein [Bacilli bacterium]
MGFINWVKNHIVSSFAIVAGVAAISVSAANFASHRGKYDDYLKDYEKNKEELKLKVPQLPNSVGIVDNFVTYGEDEISSSKSTYKNNYLYFATDATVAPLSKDVAEEIKKLDESDNSKLNNYITSLDRFGGAITFKIDAETAGYADIAIEMRTNWKNDKGEYLPYENITDQIKIQINKLDVKTEELELPAERDSFTTLVLKGTWLLEGNNTLTITSSAYNPYKSDSNKVLYVVPDIRNVAVITDATVNLVHK